MNHPTESYHAYLLRIWREQHNEKIIWRASLEEAQSGQMHGFGSLRELFAFLETQTTTDQPLSTNPQKPFHQR
ncbi:MAG: hypothetical protein H6641_09740 [Caldilineaceae bacterium]|nr:hypothetical protein [Caldilineaceae bacterium]